MKTAVKAKLGADSAIQHVISQPNSFISQILSNLSVRLELSLAVEWNKTPNNCS